VITVSVDSVGIRILRPPLHGIAYVLLL